MREREERKRETIIIAACSARVDHARDLAAGTCRQTTRSDLTPEIIIPEMMKACIGEIKRKLCIVLQNSHLNLHSFSQLNK